MRYLLVFQGIYYLVTGVWPLLSIDTFEALTGPKTDDWLVQTVGVLAACIGATLLFGCWKRSLSRETLFLSAVSAVGFLGVDVIFVSLGIISRIYLLDAAIQLVLLMSSLVIAVATRKPT
jgi:hypothetical protein